MHYLSEKDTPQSEVLATPVGPGYVEQSQPLRRSQTAIRAGTNSKGVVKRLSAHFEALDQKNNSEAEARYIHGISISSDLKISTNMKG